MWLAPVAAVLLMASQDVAAPEASEAARACRERLKAVDGIIGVGMGAIGKDFTLVVSCRSRNAREAARRRLGGERFQGLRIVWTVTPPRRAASRLPIPPPPPKAKTQETPPFDPVSATDCDIIREHLKLKPVRHRISRGRYRMPCKVYHRQVIGAGGGHSYWYTKHRGDCPVRLGRVSQPAWADNTVAWVFQKGFTPVNRSGFLWPTELRADDKLWAHQASEELKTRLPHIREGAEWVATDSGFVRTRGGSAPTGGHPGRGWTWAQPWTAANGAEASPRTATRPLPPPT